MKWSILLCLVASLATTYGQEPFIFCAYFHSEEGYAVAVSIVNQGVPFDGFSECAGKILLNPIEIN